jgi:hypothetical protein
VFSVPQSVPPALALYPCSKRLVNNNIEQISINFCLPNLPPLQRDQGNINQDSAGVTTANFWQGF